MKFQQIIASALLCFFVGCDGATPVRSSAPQGVVSQSTRGTDKPASRPTSIPARSSSEISKVELTGQVIGVSDGDTITVLDATKTQHKVRLEGIDAPESHQAWGTRSKQELSKRVYLQYVRVAVTGRDKYGRTLGHVYVGPLWVNLDMIAGGYAWHYAEHNNEAELSLAEVRARTGKVGLWGTKGPVPPWEFRHDAGIAATALERPAPATGGSFVYVTTSGTKYHQANCRHLSKSGRAIPLDEAKCRYSPCSVCTSGVDATIPNTRAAPVVAPAPLAAFDGASNAIVYVTRTGSKYHSAGCRHLSKSAIPISLGDAQRRYDACSACGS